MKEALLWGGFSGSALFLGALVGLFFRIPNKVTGYVMSLGTGILIGAATFELLPNSVEKGGMWATSIGFLLGASTFTFFNFLLARKGAHNRKRSKQNPTGHSGLAIFIGTVLDSLPEAIVIGISMIDTKVSMVLVIAIFISNLPEGLSSTIGMKKDNYSRARILTLWIVVFCLTALSALGGYVLLDNASAQLVSSINSFAAGAVVAMVCSTMAPEAYEDGGPAVGLIAAAGIIASLMLTML
ncbi:ZIP family metal transporter [Salirhabdus salicampi]|uniref:ZIP family metal transporter n=1 Tax=Salirhabdus salicampi TaxID=476102 RepID=UPI0020C34F78|nr:ZIP family metal transporter [Salirhabdus salicampi]MCP8617906.1 ZIP family metal transporter [Salirhabdus salicampi]